MIRTAILTVSDSTTAGKRIDESGPALKTCCLERGWQVVASAVVADDRSSIESQLMKWADNGDFSLILTSGGTGIAPRDVTPEATRVILDRELPGLGELMRFKGLEQTPLSPLSRALAGVRNRTLIVNLPGSPKGAVHSFNAIAKLVPHIVELLEGKTEH